MSSLPLFTLLFPSCLLLISTSFDPTPRSQKYPWTRPTLEAGFTPVTRSRNLRTGHLFIHRRHFKECPKIAMSQNESFRLSCRCLPSIHLRNRTCHRLHIRCQLGGGRLWPVFAFLVDSIDAVIHIDHLDLLLPRSWTLSFFPVQSIFWTSLAITIRMLHWASFPWYLSLVDASLLHVSILTTLSRASRCVGCARLNIGCSDRCRRGNCSNGRR